LRFLAFFFYTPNIHKLHIYKQEKYNQRRKIMNPLREFLETTGIMQKNFAKAVGTSTFTIHNILHDIRLPSLALAYKIEEVTLGKVHLYSWVTKINKRNGKINKRNNGRNNKEK
jgi:DNA-binding XRE family transcriptional regulator